MGYPLIRAAVLVAMMGLVTMLVAVFQLSGWGIAAGFLTMVGAYFMAYRAFGRMLPPMGLAAGALYLQGPMPAWPYILGLAAYFIVLGIYLLRQKEWAA